MIVGEGATVVIVGMGLPIACETSSLSLAADAVFDVNQIKKFIGLRWVLSREQTFQRLRRRDGGVPIGSVPSS
jgi:hypothetical protein